MQALADRAGVALRPHAKGHRSARIARAQLDAGAVGVAVATVREARRLLDGGITDLLLTSVVAPAAAPALAALASAGARLGVVVHTAAVVDALGAAARADGVELRVLVDVDVGQRRGGVTDPTDAVALADRVAATAGLRLDGVQGYEGHLQGLDDPQERAAGHARAMAVLDAAVAAIRAAGHAAPTVTTAGTATAPLAAAHSTVTELQPGSYALMDGAYAAMPGVRFEQAVHVVTTVTAVLGPHEVLVDAGTRAVSTDLGPPAVVGRDARWSPAGDEHGRLHGAVGDLRAGDRVRLVPSHTDTTVVLHDPL